MKDFAEFILLSFGAVVAIVLLAVLSAIPVWLLWNMVVPEIFGLPAIGLMQALALSLLSSCLFKDIISSSNK
jgi:hypothetical protein